MDLCPPGGRVRPAGQLPDPAGRAARAACGRRRPAERRRCRPVPGRPQSRRLLCPAGPRLEAGKARTCLRQCRAAAGFGHANARPFAGRRHRPGLRPGGMGSPGGHCRACRHRRPPASGGPALPHLYLRLHRRTQGRSEDPRRDAKLYRRLYRPLPCHPSRRAGQPDSVFLRRFGQGPLLDAPRRLPPGGPGHRAVLAAVPPDRVSQRPAHHSDLLGTVGAGDRLTAGYLRRYSAKRPAGCLFHRRGLPDEAFPDLAKRTAGGEIRQSLRPVGAGRGLLLL